MVINCLRKSLSFAWNITIDSSTDLVYVMCNSSVVGGYSTFQTLLLYIQGKTVRYYFFTQNPAGLMDYIISFWG